jgi:hypothetical protein
VAERRGRHILRMTDSILAPLAGWESYYVIVGSSAAALTGLQFVVIALVADVRPRSSNDTIDAFATPTIVHFCLALLTAAVLSAPWRTLLGPALSVAAVGLGGLFYEAIVIRRTRRQKDYKPVFEDWLWHTILPVIAYVAIVVGASALVADAADALFPIAAATLLLVFVGIHNAWDTVTYITLEQLRQRDPKSGLNPAPSDGASPTREREPEGVKTP